MDNKFLIKIVRASDSSKLLIGDGADYQVLNKGLDGFGSVSNTLGYTDNAIGDGSRLTYERVTKTDRTIKFAYLHPDKNDIARSKLASFFNVKDAYKIYVTYGGKTLWSTGKIYKLVIGMGANITNRLDTSVTFMFENPFWYSVDNFGKNIASIAGMTAFPYLCDKDAGVTGGVFNFAQQVEIYNDGDVETYCKVIISAEGGDVENPKLIINGEYVRIIDTMEDGEEIEMDFTAFPPTIKKAGVNYVGHCDRTSSFDGMIINRGDNIIQYDADNGSSHMNVTVYYYKQYGVI